jgi:hypothetical protein
MIPDHEVALFRQFVRTTPAAQHSTAAWSRYHNAHTRGAYDAAPRPAPTRRLLSFSEMYGIAMDQTNTSSIAGQPQVMEDHDPTPQREVESTDREPTDGGGYPSGRAPPMGKYDEPVRQRMATDPPVSEAQRKAMGAAASGHSTLGIPRSVGEHFLHDQVEAELPSERMREPPTVARGQQGVDQEHADAPEDDALIARVLHRLGFSAPDIDKAIARDRRRRAARDQGPVPFKGMPSAFAGSPKLAGDSASFLRMYPDAVRLTSHGSGGPPITPKVFVGRSRGD